METSILNSLNHSDHLAKNIAFQLDRVSVRFGNIQALQNISLVIPKGEVFFVTGKSGAGKSTLLNLLAEDLRPSSGSVIGLGHFCSQIFQDLKLIQNISLKENILISFDRRIHKSRRDFLKEMDELTNFLNITEKLSLRTDKANGGLKQKVALVRALLAKPEVILCDEPTSSCDKESSIKFFELLNFYNVNRGLTVVWATHNKDLVKQFPGKIFHLDSGRLVYSGHACFI